jgi:murein L,D-transpeptidase YcbB/YkuD
MQQATTGRVRELSLLSQQLTVRMMSRTTKTLVLASSFCALLVTGLSNPAWADKDTRNTTAPGTTPAPVAPVVLPPSVAGVDAAVLKLQQSQRLAGLAVDWPGVQAYYAAGGQVLWTTPSGYSILGVHMVQQLQQAIAAGMPANDTLRQLAASLPQQITPEQAPDAEAWLSALYTASAYDAVAPLGTTQGQGAKLLPALAQSKDPVRAVGQQLPSFEMFWRLYAALPHYVHYYEQGGWPKVSGNEKIEIGDENTRVGQVKNRLLVTGELAQIGPDPELYDGDLELAVRQFQRNHGLNDDGVIGKRTIEEMNISAEQRLKQVLLNLDRMRQQSPDFEERYVFVNIPSTELRVIDGGITTFHSKAIVGRVARKTPTLKSEIFQVKLNPDWSVPGKIAAIDMLKHELEEPGYFAEKNVRVYTTDGKLVDPTRVNWREVKASGKFPYRLKQDAGPENALGPMKLDFQNDYAVFVHGTSTPQLFVKQDRFFSSGCVRVEDPLGLATFLLQDDPSWTRERVEDVVRGGKTTFAKLARPIPVHFVYMTAWVDEAGQAHFRQDVYDKDPGVSIPVTLNAPTLIAEQANSTVIRQGTSK